MPDDTLTSADLPLIVEALRRRAAPGFLGHWADEEIRDGGPLPERPTSYEPDDIDDEWTGRSGPIDY